MRLEKWKWVAGKVFPQDNNSHHAEQNQDNRKGIVEGGPRENKNFGKYPKQRLP